MDWEIPSPEYLIEDNTTKFVHFYATNCGFDGYIEDLFVNWLHPLILVAKTDNTNGDNPTWRQAMNGPFNDEY